MTMEMETAAPAVAAAAATSATDVSTAPADSTSTMTVEIAAHASASASPTVFNGTGKVVVPTQTVYVKNVDEKVKIAELKKAFYHIFSQFGNVLEVKAWRTDRLRGQAWVVFNDVVAATRAVKEMQSFMFFRKPIIVQFAAVECDVVTKARGTYVDRPRKAFSMTMKQEKDVREAAERERARQHVIQTFANQDASAGGSNSSSSSSSSSNGTHTTSNGVIDASHAIPPSSLSSASSSSSSTSAASTAAAAAAAAAPSIPEAQPPHRILFVEGLPDSCNEAMLNFLFSSYTSFTESRLVPGRPGIAFIEYGEEADAVKALETLNGFKISPTHPMHVTYAKK